jgi:hypothetical protein
MMIFEPVFGDKWQKLPPIFKKHYAVRQNSDDVVTVTGEMVITMSPLFKLLSPLLKFMGLLVPYEGRFKTTVHFRAAGEAFVFDRLIHISPTKTYIFKSKMTPQGGNLMLERMNFGVQWLASYDYIDEKVVITHKGYKFFGIPMPIEWLFGRGNAYEIVVDDNNFAMKMTISHKVFGVLYDYSGEFNAS